MMIETQVLALDRHKHIVGLNRLMRFQSSPSRMVIVVDISEQ